VGAGAYAGDYQAQLVLFQKFRFFIQQQAGKSLANITKTNHHQADCFNQGSPHGFVLLSIIV
jgi:hypothetical protein